MIAKIQCEGKVTTKIIDFFLLDFSVVLRAKSSALLSGKINTTTFPTAEPRIYQ